MTKPASALYAINHFDLGKKITVHLTKGIEQAGKRPLVFFRADDIGIPSHRFQQLIDCFKSHNLPLCLATVPAWLTQERLVELRRLTGVNTLQWCWHQHGYIHRNFEKNGKKQEFGPTRTEREIRASLTKGRDRLEQLLERDFRPVFTPPWNRCSNTALQILADLDYRAVSRSRGASPQPPPILPDLQVNVDLHTRKETDPQLAVNNFLEELEAGLASGLCGIMIHHQRMNKAALGLLDILLAAIKANSNLQPVTFTDLM